MNKGSYMLACAALLCSTALYGQATDSTAATVPAPKTESPSKSQNFKRVRLGFKIAPAVVWMKANSANVHPNGSKLGFSYGLMLDYNFSRNYALATGVEVVYRGGKLEVDETDGIPSTFPVTYNLQYIQVPLALKMKTNEIGYMRYFGVLGFENGFNIRARGTNVSDYKPSDGDKDDVRSQIAMYNLTLHFQAGLEYAMSQDLSLLVSLYFSNGFLDVISTTEPNFDARSNGLGLNIGVYF